MTSRQQDCLAQMRDIYTQFTGEEVAHAIRIIRAELVAEESRTDLQREILAKQLQLEKLTQKK